MRRWLTFDVDGARCMATLDEGERERGLLIVSGGNEVRCGAHRGMATLAARIAACGYSVLRFDRRGIGDSEGENGGFESSGPDIAAAVELMMRECPALRTIVVFGNCDAATALLLHRDAYPAMALVLANPWTRDEAQGDAMPPPAAIRARYADRLRDPRAWWRLLSGGVSLKRLWRGMRAASQPAAPSSLADRLFIDFMAMQNRSITILLAEGDTTAQAFAAEWASKRYAAIRGRPTVTMAKHPTGSHGFADVDASDWLFTQILAAIEC